MYRVLLADNDVENLQNFRRYIAGGYNDFRIIKSLSALSGDYIGEIIKAEPQLIIADIRFFGVNGPYSFSEIVRRIPSVQFILYGGFNDMDYLEHSIEEQKVDYIIKPIKPSDLGRALDSAKAHLELLSQREKQLKELGESFKLKTGEFRNEFLKALVSGVITDEDEILENFRHFNLDMSEKFTIVQIKIDHFKTVNLTMDITEKHYLIYRICSLTDMCLTGIKHFSFINGFNAVTVIISGVNGLGDIFRQLENIKNEAVAKLKIAVTIGVGRTYEKVSEISISFREAESATRHRFYVGYNTIIPIEFVDGGNYITYRYPSFKEERLILAAATGEFEYCKNLLNEIFDALRRSEPLPEKLMAQTVICILISMERYLMEQNKFENVKVSNFFTASEAMRIKTVDEGYAYLYTNLQRFCQYVSSFRGKQNIETLETAKEYVLKKYYETISLQKAAIELKTTPEYLNRLLMSSEGCGYFDYVTKVRLEIAKRFLIETQMDDSAIAVNIGYDDGKYFKAVFRQHEKMDTTEYRNNYGKKL